MPTRIIEAKGIAIEPYDDNRYQALDDFMQINGTTYLFNRADAERFYLWGVELKGQDTDDGRIIGLREAYRECLHQCDNQFMTTWGWVSLIFMGSMAGLIAGMAAF